MYIGTQTRQFLPLSGVRSPRRRGRKLGDPGWRQYEEQVITRHGNGRYTILLSDSHPLTTLRGNGKLGALGNLGVALSPGGSVGPWTLIGPATVSKSGGAASSALLSASQGAAQGLALGGPIGAGIGALAGAIAGLWASHAARTKGAKAENQAINSAVSTFDQGMQAIFAAANSTNPLTSITAAQAAQSCQTLLQTFFQVMAPFTHGPGAADASNGGMNCGNGTLNPGGPCTGTPGGHQCNAQCTATCCVGCQDLYPTVLQALAVFASPTGGTVTACTVYGSKYGATQRGSYNLSYTPPAASSVAGVANSLTSGLTSVLTTGSLTSLETSTVAGIPLWLILVGAGIGIFAITR